jgi:transcriptional regulator with XRE-family HTH domain
MNLGQTIMQLRERKGLNQKALAERCCITQAYLSQLENNKRFPNISTLNVIGEVLDVPVPIIFFLSIDKSDFPQRKQKAFDSLYPTMLNLVEDVFVNLKK